MSDWNPLPAKVDIPTAFIATTGLPAPFWIPAIDETAKIVAIVYSILGAVYLFKKIFLEK